MLPEGWETSTVGAHTEVLTGFAFKSEDYISSVDGMKLLRGDNVGQGRLRWRDVKRYPQSQAANLARYELQAGDFVIAMDRTWIPAGVKISEVRPHDLPCLLVQRVARLRTKPSLRQDLLRQFFAGHRFEQFVKGVQTETAVPHISPNDVKSFEIALPPLPEQRKIAEILSTWDAAIGVQERLIANAKRQKKALMQTLLPTGAQPPKKRLPGFSGAWVSRVFGAIAESEKRRIDPKSLTSATKCVELEHIESETGALLGFCDARAQASLKSVFEPGYILYGKLRPYLRKFHRPDFSGVCSTEIWSIKANEKICLPDFLYYLVQSPAFGEAVDISSGSKMPRADWGIVKGAKFQLPDLNEQRAICDVLDAAETELSYSQQHLATLAREKSALMQQLLTGKRRVKAEGAA